ncbi:hypothetical protein [Hyphomicrobium sp.]|uniref:hypothetical protein n=1 Tax=Hyphomicrobium sp. TaxID=82 RepID=UPI002E33905A|nr:hypothetical protein [Hyphomicrobium sp.]HEX2841406.1 hypothetical protein [Hyphomicrobium sp.]
MQAWEYMQLDLNDLPAGGSEIQLLNRVGAQGWELVTITRHRLAVLKKAIEPTKQK